MVSPLWTWLSVCISLMPMSPDSSDRSLFTRAHPAPWLIGLPGLTGLKLVLVLHRLHPVLAGTF